MAGQVPWGRPPCYRPGIEQPSAIGPGEAQPPYEDRLAPRADIEELVAPEVLLWFSDPAREVAELRPGLRRLGRIEPHVLEQRLVPEDAARGEMPPIVGTLVVEGAPMTNLERFYSWHHRTRPLAVLLPLAIALLLTACNSGGSGGYKY